MSNKEQFTICLRWVNEHLVDHEDVLRLYKVDVIDAGSIVNAIDELACLIVSVVDSAMMVLLICHGVEMVQIRANESRTVLTHCYGHALNVAISDTIKQLELEGIGI